MGHTLAHGIYERMPTHTYMPATLKEDVFEISFAQGLVP